MRSSRTWWIIFGACAVLVSAALLWMTVEVVRLERAELAARAEAAHQESLRLALWRMDSWVSPHLARESARQYFEYRSFHPEQLAYTRTLHRIEAEEVLTPSPLLSFESEFIRLHFQVAPDGAIGSPQVPTGNERDLIEAAYLSSERLATNASTLTRLRALMTPNRMLECAAAVDAVGAPASLVAASPSISPDDPAPQLQEQVAQVARTQQEWSMRLQSYLNTNAPAPAQWIAPIDESGAPSTVTVEPLVPIWVGNGDATGEDRTEELIFVRRVRLGDGDHLQGFLCDWPQLRAALLEVVADLFPEAILTPITETPRVAAAYTLATIPAKLEVPPAPLAAVSMVSPARWTLMLTWVVVLGGLIAVAITLRASILFGERRSRFASAVTHELRTPLTTFRMYSEMLAEGMVRSDEQRRLYLNTLRDESDRLAALVENVLAYARLERGRERVEPLQTTLGGLIDELRPRLERQTERSGMVLDIGIEGDAGTPLVTDVEAVGQILLNLVENACKYAGEGSDRTIHLECRVAGGDVLVDVRDHGPGIPPEHARGVFAPFERGARSSGDPTPGVGLGLALARGLARSLGGDLRLMSAAAAAPGACFRLRLPGG